MCAVLMSEKAWSGNFLREMTKEPFERKRMNEKGRKRQNLRQQEEFLCCQRRDKKGMSMI